MFKVFLYLILFILNAKIACVAQKTEAIKLNLRMQNNKVEKYSDLKIYFNFFNNSTTTKIILNSNFEYGFYSNYKDTKIHDIVFYLEKITKGKFTTQSPLDPYYSSDRWFNKEGEIRFDTLIFNTPSVYFYNVYNYYNFRTRW